MTTFVEKEKTDKLSTFNFDNFIIFYINIHTILSQFFMMITRDLRGGDDRRRMIKGYHTARRYGLLDEPVPFSNATLEIR